jgi:fructose/tagatose bisphosphate aldolase
MAGKAIIIHSLEHARAALAAAAALEVPVTLASAPGASAYAGPAWFQEVVRLAKAEFPGVEADATMDCAERPGDVLAALRQGLLRVRFTGRKAVAEKLAAMAEAQGAELVTGRLRALDLRGLTDPDTACRAWLGEGQGDKQ